MEAVNIGEPFTHRGVSIHKRIPCRKGQITCEPPTYWLTLSMPWKRLMFDINQDAMVRAHPRYSLGFRFFKVS